jgi:hypothetical protein
VPSGNRWQTNRARTNHGAAATLAEADAEAAWNIEIERRIEAIEAGTSELESWEQVKRRIERDMLGR